MGKKKRCGNCGKLGHNRRTCEAASTEKVVCHYCSQMFSPKKAGFLRHIKRCPVKNDIVTKKLTSIHGRLKFIDSLLRLPALFAIGWAIGNIAQGLYDAKFTSITLVEFIEPYIEKIGFAILAGVPKVVSWWLLKKSVNDLEEALAVHLDAGM